MADEKQYHRRSMRLTYLDYAFPGMYFVTICAHERHSVFGLVRDARVVPSKLGQLVRECWVAIPEHFAQVELHEFVIMPNHLHGLIGITRKTSAPPVSTQAHSVPFVGAQHCCALPSRGLGPAAVTPGSLGAIIRSFKSIVARRAHKELGRNGPIWQRNYFERVLRDGKEYADVSRYIAENPRKWEWDRENPECRTR
jgi:REP element-mobilizing transposase RayT